MTGTAGKEESTAIEALKDLTKKYAEEFKYLDIDGCLADIIDEGIYEWEKKFCHDPMDEDPGGYGDWYNDQRQDR